MKLHRQIKVQKLQTKNRMTGQTFNPSGITSAQIAEREKEFISIWERRGVNERTEYWGNVLSILEFRKINHIRCSWEWEWCVFSRYFTFNGAAI